jgi:hypothetical protein
MAWRAVCDRCGFDRRNDELRLEWTGLRVCAVVCHDRRHPQDAVRGKPERGPLPWARPVATPVYVAVGEVTHEA